MAAAPRTRSRSRARCTAPVVLEAVALYGDTTEASAEKLGDLSAIRDDTGGLESASRRPRSSGLGGGVEQLIEYPYGCTEQLASRLVPMLPLRDLARDYHVACRRTSTRSSRRPSPRSSPTSAATAASALGRVTEASPWVTAYALWGLDEAKRTGATVPESAHRGGDALPARRRSRERDSDPARARRRPSSSTCSPRTDAPDPGRMSRSSRTATKLPLFARAQLAPRDGALEERRRAASRSSRREIEGHIRLDGNVARAVDNDGDGYAALMDSEARTTALVLRGLMAARPVAPARRRKLAMGLLACAPGGTWRNDPGDGVGAARARRLPPGAGEDRARLRPRACSSARPRSSSAPFHGRSPRPHGDAMPRGELWSRARRRAARVRRRWQGPALLRGAPALREEGAAAETGSTAASS